MHEFVPRLAWFGVHQLAGANLLKLTSPGVPDITRGRSYFDFSLVDPDNRRPVDFAVAEKYLTELETREASPELCRELLEHWTDGRLKLWVTHRALHARSEASESVSPWRLPRSRQWKVRVREHVVAFTRRHQQAAALVAVPRLSLHHAERRAPAAPRQKMGQHAIAPTPEFAAAYFTTRSPASAYQFETMASCLCGEVFASFPVALLVE